MNRAAYDRFKSDEDPVEPDRSAFQLGVMTRQQGGRLDDDPFKRGYWLSNSWRAGWCDEDQSQLAEPHRDP